MKFRGAEMGISLQKFCKLTDIECCLICKKIVFKPINVSSSLVEVGNQFI